MKKLICTLLASALLLTAGIACAQTAETPADTLIVCFAVADNSEVDAVSSASVVEYHGAPMGKVSVLASMIQQKTGADLFSIDTDVAYPAGIMDLIDFALVEQDENTRPAILNSIENIDQYNTIFVGYPLWWYDLPRVMYTFFDMYDLSGKTVIPFCTHNGSRFSGTIGTIEELEPDATVIHDGFTVSEWDVLEAGADVDAWLSELGY